jgi:potassium-transporting ATPase potassium-binding subunit
MTANGWLQILLYLAILTAIAPPLGRFMAAVYEGRRTFLTPALGGLERLTYRMCGVKAEEEMTWKTYAIAVLLLTIAGLVSLYALLRLQAWLPLNPMKLGPPSPALAFNTSVSFVTNTNWQAYGGETTLSAFTQMFGLAVHNFLSAATGMAVAAALIRGFARRSMETIGNFWVDLTRSTLYVLLPLSLVLALLLVSQGVVQSFEPSRATALLERTLDAQGHAVSEQSLPMGPAASQVAIKQLGTNGGGFFNANSAHPFENPTPVSNALELLAILALPAAFCFMFGRMVRDERQGWAIYAAMFVLFVALLALCVGAEQSGNPLLTGAGADQRATALQAGGNMEGKEARFGIVNSALWATATTAASNGSVNAMHDSFTPLGGLATMWLMQLGEVVFGGVGSGLYGMLIFAIVAVFISGLMVGRTPEYLGKKIESYEMKMASLAILLPPMAVLLGTAVSVMAASAQTSIANPGMHGFGEVLYAFSSAANNNGSAFAGLNANTPWFNVTTALAMFVGRFGVAIPVLAIAGALARKKSVPGGPGTLPTHTPLFVTLLVGVVIVVGALTFIPALSLGPVVEHLQIIHSAADSVTTGAR